MEALDILLALHTPEVRPDLAERLAERGLRVEVTRNQADTWAAAHRGPDAILLAPVGPDLGSAELQCLIELSASPEGPALVVLTARQAELLPWAEQLDDFLAPDDDVDLIARRLLFCVARRRPLRRLYEERETLLHQTHTDFKTRLWNERHFNERCRIECARTGREETSLAVLMIDVDDFKSINDRHDHAFGDHALLCLADTLRSGLRPFDTPARMGGDEFAVLLPNTGFEDACHIAERLRGAVAHTDLEQGSHAARMSVTIGVAAWSPGCGETFEEARRGADRALLEAKRQGRNRVGQHRPPITARLSAPSTPPSQPPAREAEAPSARKGGASS